MDETVISWNVANVISILLMLLIIWIVFGAIGHFVFRTGSKGPNTTVSVAPPQQVLGV